MIENGFNLTCVLSSHSRMVPDNFRNFQRGSTTYLSRRSEKHKNSKTSGQSENLCTNKLHQDLDSKFSKIIFFTFSCFSVHLHINNTLENKRVNFWSKFENLSLPPPEFSNGSGHSSYAYSIFRPTPTPDIHVA